MRYERDFRVRDVQYNKRSLEYCLAAFIGMGTLLDVNHRREKFASADLKVRTALYNIMHNVA